MRVLGVARVPGVVREPGGGRPSRHRGLAIEQRRWWVSATGGSWRPPQHPHSSPEGLDAEEAPPSGLPPTFIRFAHHSYAQMVRVLKRTAARCPHVAKTYSIGRSFNGKELLVIEFSARPGQHELSKLTPRTGPQREVWVWASSQEWAPGLLGLGVQARGRGPHHGGRQGAGRVCVLLGALGHVATSHRACWGSTGRWELGARPGERHRTSLGKRSGGSPVAAGMWAPVRPWRSTTVLCAFCRFCNLSLARSDPGRHVLAWSWPLHAGSSSGLVNVISQDNLKEALPPLRKPSPLSLV